MESSHNARSKKHRLKTLLNDIKKNRYRVYSILLRLNDVQGDEDLTTNALQQLAREELLSLNQYKKLRELEEITLSAIANIIKETKSVYGIEFLPRTIGNLSKKLPLLVTELTEIGSSRARNELAAVLQVLLRQGNISLARYTSIKDDHDIL